jgi:uncharacterized protein YjbI with pentapeptide repeats
MTQNHSESSQNPSPESQLLDDFETLYASQVDGDQLIIGLYKISEKFGLPSAKVKALYDNFSKEKSWRAGIHFHFKKLHSFDHEQRTIALFELAKELNIPKEEIQVLYDKYSLLEKYSKRLEKRPRLKHLFQGYIENWHHGIIGRLSKVALIIGLPITILQLYDAVQKYSLSNQLKQEENQLAKKAAIQDAWQALKLSQEERQAGFGRAEALQLLATEGIPLDGVNLDGVNLNLLDLSPSQLQANQLDLNVSEPSQNQSAAWNPFDPVRSQSDSDIDEQCRDRFPGRAAELYREQKTPKNVNNLPSCVHMQRAQFRGAQLQASNLSHANLIQADFGPYPKPTSVLPLEGRTNLTNARLIKADLRNANFAKAVLTKADLTGAWFSWTTMGDADIPEQASAAPDLADSSESEDPIPEAVDQADTTAPDIGTDTEPVASGNPSPEAATIEQSLEEAAASEAIAAMASDEDSREPEDTIIDSAASPSPPKQDGSLLEATASNTTETEPSRPDGAETDSGTNLAGAELGYANLTDITIEGDQDTFFERLTSDEKGVGANNWQFVIYSDNLRRHPALCGKVVFLVREPQADDADAIGHKPALTGEAGTYGIFRKQEFKDYFKELRETTNLPENLLRLECFSFVNFKGPIGKELFYRELAHNIVFKGSAFNDLDLSNPEYEACQHSFTEDQIPFITYLTFSAIMGDKPLDYRISKTQFENASLIRSNLCGVTLQDVKFTAGSDISGLDLSASTLANLVMSDIEGYNSRSTEYAVNFEAATLNNSTIQRAQFETTNFSHAKLQNIKIIDALLNNSIFEAAHINKSRFDSEPNGNNSLLESNFRSSKIEETDFWKSDLGKSVFIDAILHKVDFRESTLNDANFSAASLNEVTLVDVPLDNVAFENSAIQGLTIFNAKGADGRVNFRNADITSLKIYGSDTAIGLDFENATIHDSEFYYTVKSLGGSNFQKADLSRVSFAQASLVNANFSNTTLNKVDFSGSGLQRVNFEGATFNSVQMDAQTNLTYANLSNIRVVNPGVDDTEAIETFLKDQIIAGRLHDDPKTNAVEDHWKTTVYDAALRQNSALCQKVFFLVQASPESSSKVLGHLPDIPRHANKGNLLTQAIFRGYLDQLKAAGNVNLRCFSFENFVGSDFLAGYQNLSGFELNTTNLQDMNLTGTNLSGADLRGADLRGANLSGANLQSAKLRCADLSTTVGLDVEQVQQADFRGAIFSEGFQQRLEAATGEPLPSTPDC